MSKRKVSAHATRMFRIGRLAPPHPETEDGRLIRAWAAEAQNSPSMRREVEAGFEKALAQVSVQSENGAGFPMDKLLRYFSAEYNSRNFEHGLHSMPSSFSVMEAFFDYVPALSLFKLRAERDNALSFMEFLDYMTSGDSPNDIKGAADSIEENIIYTYNVLNDPEDITFSTIAGPEYGVGGVSLIRHGHEITILLLAGEKTDLDAKTVELAEGHDVAVAYGREGIEPDKGLSREAVPLLGKPDFWQTLALTRFNLEDMTYDSRHVHWDAGNCFVVLTDDVSVFLDATGNFLKPEIEATFKKCRERLEGYASLFEICKTSIYLPQYFDFYGSLVTEERHETILGQKRNSPKRRKWCKLTSSGDRIHFRRVSVLERPNPGGPDRMTYITPDFQVDASGFWRPLPPGRVGEDKNGRRIHARTWVRKTLSWVDKDAGAPVVGVKTSRGAAGADSEARGDDSGYVYVMRTAAHVKDIFKIGMTQRDPDLRSAELSGSTNSPDKFLVVQEWNVSDPATAEKLIFERLNKYRLNPNREFFRAPYQEIFKTIHEVIAELDAATATRS